MPNTYEPIATTTLGSATASHEFTSISGTYTDLVLIIGNLKATTSTPYLCYQFNSNTASNYSSTILEGNGTTASSNRWSNETQLYTGYNVGLGTTSDAMVITNFMNYSNSTTNKTSLTRVTIPNNGAPGTGAVVGLWRQTAAITSIKVFNNAGNLPSGCTLTLYGIKAA
jgi:hypothetical protein